MASTSTSGEECYTSTQHGTKVVGGFERLWRESLMCDTTLVAESKSFKVHRSYLAACSHYFHAMFTEGFRESEQNQVFDWFVRFTQQVSCVGVVVTPYRGTVYGTEHSETLWRTSAKDLVTTTIESTRFVISGRLGRCQCCGVANSSSVCIHWTSWNQPNKSTERFGSSSTLAVSRGDFVNLQNASVNLCGG